MKNSHLFGRARRPSYWLTAAALLALAFKSSAAIPPAEKILPDDTLVLLTMPDFTKIREIYKSSPQSQFWNDPAMKPFKDKFLTKWKEEFVQPLERELNLRFEDYIGLPQGQLTFAVTQNGWQGDDDKTLGMVLLLDAKDKSGQLKTNLADLRQKWVERGKAVKTEKIRDLEFSVLAVSSNDMPKTLKKFFPGSAPVEREPGAEEPAAKPAGKSEWVIGQFESLLIVGNSTKVVERIVIRLTGGAMPSLGELAAYDGNHQALFRDSPGYGWVNMKAFIDIFTRKPSENKTGDLSDPLSMFKTDKVITATGLAGLKTVAFNFHNTTEGSLVNVLIGVPESARQGIFKILAGEAKETSAPAFVPADAVKFQRWRIDGQKAWATLEKMLGDISPQLVGYLNFVIDSANTAAKEKDPGFDLRKNLIGNLGDDMISYEKAPRGGSIAQLQTPPSLFLLGSPNPEQFVAALKGILGSLSQQANSPAEREFLGRKIYNVPMPTLPFPTGDSKPAAPRTLSYAATSGYVVMSTEASLLEEYLRSSENQGKSLRETAGLVEATQKVSGPGTAFLGYENQAETMRATFEQLRKDPAGATNELLGVFSSVGAAAAGKALGWMDYSLLPSFDKVAKYFHFTVQSGSASVDGLSFKVFAPVPPGLKK